MSELSYIEELKAYNQFMITENELSDFIINEKLESFNIDIFNIESDILNNVFTESKFSTLTESVSSNLNATIKKLFVDLISEIRRFITDIKIGTERSGREMTYRAKLDKMEVLVKDARSMGKTSVIMANVVGMMDVYKKYYNELSSHVKKITKMHYKDTLALDKDIEKYHQIVNKWEKQFEAVSKEEVRISIEDAIRFVEHEKSNNSKVLDTLNDLITDVQLMQKDVEDIIDKESKLGSDVIPKHVSIIGRLTGDMFKSIRKMCGKIIGKIVFRFA